MPKMLGPTPGNPSERVVYHALKSQLPQDWVVVADVAWTERTGSDDRRFVRDGQADFVVLAPGHGMCILEVKGSRFIRVDEAGHWCRSHDGRTWTDIGEKTPPKQATSNMHQIARLAARRYGWTAFPFSFGYLVAYPNGLISDGGFSTFHESTLIMKRHMNDIARRVRSALEARIWGAKASATNIGFTPALAMEIGELLVNYPLEIVPPATGAELEADLDAIKHLTRQQSAALSGIFRHPRVAVTGPAGSGKTTLAIWRLSALIEEGKNAMLLCYNQQLVHFLSLEHPELAPYMNHVDRHFAAIAKNRRRIPDSQLSHYFEVDLPGLVLDAQDASDNDAKLDALIIDEGQDFGAFRLWAARELIKPDGEYLYCSDDRQDLYNQETREAVGAEIVFSLIHNCRNTVRINETGNKALDSNIEPMPGLPHGMPTRVEHYANSTAMAKEAWRLASEWSKGGKVAILSPYRLENSAMAKRPTGHGMQLVTELAKWNSTGAVLFSTIKSFKGLEADAVIVVDAQVPQETGPVTRSDLYVACTRARGRLALLAHTSAFKVFLA